MTTTIAPTATFKDILSNPEEVIPFLSHEDSKRILMEAILAYIDKTTDFETLLRVGELLTQYSKEQMTPQTAHALETLNTLSFCKENPCPMDTMDNTLINILEELVA